MPFNVQGNERAKRKADIKVDARLAQLRNATPAQIEVYINNNVTDLASAKEVMKTMAKVMVYLLRQVDGDNN